MIAEKRLKSAMEILEEFRPLDIPLSRFLSAWFKLHPNAGSRDRRILSDLVYSYFRCFHWIGNISLREKILASYILMGNQDQDVLGLLGEGFFQNFALIASEKDNPLSLSEGERKDLPEKLQEVFPNLIWDKIFPWQELLSENIAIREVEKSLLKQPKLFIRIQKDGEVSLKNALYDKGISYEVMNSFCWAFDNRTSLKGLEMGNTKSTFEIQDYSSQKTWEYFKAKPRSNWWDCCAGGGGKSLLLSQMYPEVNLWASDSRFSVISNLEARFMQSGYSTPRTFVQDLVLEENIPVRESFFDGIVLDAPCTGSGTWSRTPERLGNFHPSSLGRITDIQKKIGDHIFRYLKPGGFLIYITCSIFKAENEDLVEYFVERYGYSVQNMEYLKGFSIGADTLFIARLEKRPYKA